MRLAKTIDELYDEVKDYDLVICNDAPLALALNNRIDKPFVGTFAVTARQLASELAVSILGKGTLSDIRVTQLLTERTGHEMRFVHGELENIKDIRRFTPDVGKHLGKKGREILAEYSYMPTLDNAMALFNSEESDFFDGKKVAVIGGELFDDLDKHMNPKFGTFQEVSPFKRGEYRIPEIREVGNDRQVAENAVSLIARETAEDFAIVIDVGSPIADAVRSALYRRGLPFKNSLTVKDLNHVRDFLSFVGSSLSYETLRFGQVRELLSAYGGWLPSKYDNYLVNQHARLRGKKERTDELLGIMSRIREMTFLEVCESAVPSGRRAQVKILLDEMEMSNEKVTEADLNTINYAVNNIGDLKHNEQIPDDEKRGVLLVDCKNSAYVDRAVVLFLGMGIEWEKDLSAFDFLRLGEKKDEQEKDLERFQILLQQGSSRIYLVNTLKDGKKPKPCIMFDQAEGSAEESDTFADVCDRLVTGRWVSPEGGDGMMFGDMEMEIPEYRAPLLSKSSFNNYIECPRRYFFNILAPFMDNENTVIGDAVHQYTEFRASHPELAATKPQEYYVDKIAGVFAGLVSRELTNVEKTNVRNAIGTLDAFFSSIGDTAGEMVPVEDTENMFLQDFGLTEKSANCEFKVSSEDKNMTGNVDFLHKGRIYDFKTGFPKKMTEMVKNMEGEGEYVEFQPLFYMSLLDGNKGFKGEFSFIFTKEDSVRMFEGKPAGFASGIRSVVLAEDKMEFLRDYYIDDLLRYPEIEGYGDAVISCIERHGLDNVSKKNKEFLEDLRAAVNKAISKQQCETIANNVEKLTKADIPFSEKNSVACVTKECLGRFNELVARERENIAVMSATEFPAKPRKGCDKCYFRSMCTMEPMDGGEVEI